MLLKCIVGRNLPQVICVLPYQGSEAKSERVYRGLIKEIFHFQKSGTCAVYIALSVTGFYDNVIKHYNWCRVHHEIV